MKRAQAGSAGSVVFLLVVAGLVWWQWDTITGLFGGGGRAVVELLDYRCDRQADGRIRVSGKIRNKSEAPMRLRVVTALNYERTASRADSHETPVRPSPVGPGQEGGFDSEGPALPEGGSCKLDSLLDTETGRKVGYTRGR